MKPAILYEHEGVTADLSKVTRLYPAALIHAAGERASVSLEWAELKEEVITLECYVLICDFDPVGEVPVNRIEFHYPTKESLFDAMHEIARLVNA
ncbi:MAG: hypothetical protein M0P91_11795 [Sulfuricurvum sp.]|jgi:hypothetical protein|uniref:hypothetical protein n=1 Tax=Sulfuricurvum sp. TaxID=2025608 RepID=UPI0025FD957B|nr:hypothetical protein [Sulfuricurvum sp.]MCK9373870.1 hypothetical protein [Sulfuricurvum sp.]